MQPGEEDSLGPLIFEPFLHWRSISPLFSWGHYCDLIDLTYLHSHPRTRARSRIAGYALPLNISAEIKHWGKHLETWIYSPSHPAFAGGGSCFSSASSKIIWAPCWTAHRPAVVLPRTSFAMSLTKGISFPSWHYRTPRARGIPLTASRTCMRTSPPCKSSAQVSITCWVHVCIEINSQPPTHSRLCVGVWDD